MNKSLFLALVAFFSISTLHASESPVDRAPKQKSKLYKSFVTILQVLNDHPYIWTAPLAYYAYKRDPITAKDDQNAMILKCVLPTASWIFAGSLLQSSTEAVMRQAEVEPLHAHDVNSAIMILAEHDRKVRSQKNDLLRLSREY